MCAKLAATPRLEEGGGGRMNSAHTALHGDAKLEEQGGSYAAEDPNISPSVTALLGRLPRATEEFCAIQ